MYTAKQVNKFFKLILKGGWDISNVFLSYIYIYIYIYWCIWCVCLSQGPYDVGCNIMSLEGVVPLMYSLAESGNAKHQVCGHLGNLQKLKNKTCECLFSQVSIFRNFASPSLIFFIEKKSWKIRKNAINSSDMTTMKTLLVQHFYRGLSFFRMLQNHKNNQRREVTTASTTTSLFLAPCIVTSSQIKHMRFCKGQNLVWKKMFTVSNYYNWTNRF